MTKSASTFLYQLTEEIFRVAGLDPVRLGPPFRSRPSVDNFFNEIDGELLAKIADTIGEASAVLKTHSRPHPEIVARVAGGEIRANVSYRDPRELALSMVDHGERARRLGRSAFSEYFAPGDTMQSLDDQVESCRLWADISGVEVFSYNEICFDTEATVGRICAQLGVAVDIRKVTKRFRSWSRIGEYSKGVPLRYREEMPEAEQRRFLERYAWFYKRFSFDTPTAMALAERQNNLKKRPVGGLGLKLIAIRRRHRI